MDAHLLSFRNSCRAAKGVNRADSPDINHVIFLAGFSHRHLSSEEFPVGRFDFTGILVRFV